MTDILVNTSGLILMGAIVWWFWLSPTPSAPRTDPDPHH